MSQIQTRTLSLHTRREFLRTSMLGAAAAWTLPVFLHKTFGALHAIAADSPIQTETGKDSRILVVLQMAGGNDGLNTVVPYADDAYYKARRQLAIPARNVLKLSDYVGLNPRLRGLRSLYDEGHLAVIQGVGYPNPNRSHFRSTEIWQTASDSNRQMDEGWLGSYFENCCRGADPTVGVSIGKEVPQAFASPNPTGVSLSSPEQYRWIAGDDESGLAKRTFRDLNRPDDDSEDGEAGGSIGTIGGGAATGGDTLDFLQRTAMDARISSERILEIAKNHRSTVDYPNGRLASSLHLVARMIAGGLPTRVYYVSQGGYDTHSGQRGAHERLLAELDGALGAFCKDLKQQRNWNRVALMTFSEFGRRVVENSSGGTDHGAAAPMFLAGGAIKAGMHGNHPSLTDLYRGDLKYNVDFRGVYASVLEQWLHAPGERVLGRKFQTLPLFV